MVVLIEPTSVKNNEYRKWLADYDERRYRHCATVVVGPGGTDDTVFRNSKSSDLFFNTNNVEMLGLRIDESLEKLQIALSSSGSAKRNMPVGGAMPSL